jgi:hypothetical protein
MTFGHVEGGRGCASRASGIVGLSSAASSDARPDVRARVDSATPKKRSPATFSAARNVCAIREGVWEPGTGGPIRVGTTRALSDVAHSPSLYVHCRRSGDATADLFDAIATGILKVDPSNLYPFSQLIEAHHDLEERRTTSAAVLRVTAADLP